MYGQLLIYLSKITQITQIITIIKINIRISYNIQNLHLPIFKIVKLNQGKVQLNP
jgi:hypothetical protein